ncbi:MAG: UDP-N-acetylmuramate dehydrogenase [bacterium]|nr:UDP-N-acetylmuramate dehydrogenase [bacterium]
MALQFNVSLKSFNTFGLDVKAKYFTEVNSLAELKSTLANNGTEATLFIGGGSNLLFTKDYDGLVIVNKIKGIVIEKETDESVYLKAYSGENWHELVQYCVEKNWGGIENMSLIPGTVGASPMQNIGAYGVEIENVFEHLEALNLETLEIEKFNKEACEFGYRESIFKRKLKGRYFIYSVTFRLSKQHHLKLEYGDIKTILAEQAINLEVATIKDVSNAIISIRQSKLPDPKILGNSGSFFKNPTIPVSHFDQLKIQFPDIKGFAQNEGIKVPAGWLIEQCGWKGKQIGNTGSHAKQALVLVNYGGATGHEVYQLAMDIIESIKEKFGITLEPEVNII